METLRAALKIPAFTLVTFFWWGASFAGHALLAAVGRPSAGWRARMLRYWARTSKPTLGLRTRVHGTPPKPPFFLVCNHLSYLDIIVLGAHLHAVFIARGDAADWPVFGSVCRAGATLFVDRERKRDLARVTREIEAVLEQGVGVVLFPEGTSSDGSEVLDFKPSLLEVAARARLPVSYAALTYRTPRGAGPARTRVCWWGDAGFGEHMIGLFKLPRIEATLEFGEETITAESRKQLASRLWQAVASQFRPVVD